MADVSDKKRLQQVQQQDLTESRLNDDFVFWLKTKGVNYLLVLLIIACAWMGWNWWKDRQAAARDRAWADFAQATLPQAFDEVARMHAGIDSVALFAWLKAGDAHLREIQTGMVGGGSGGVGPDGMLVEGAPLDAEALAIARSSADAYYAKVLETAGPDEGRIPFRIAALFGRAAIAESLGDLDAARGHLAAAASLAEGPWPAYATQAKSRIESLSLLTARPELPPAASLPTRPVAPTTTPSPEDLIRSLQGQPGSQPGSQPTTAPTFERIQPPAELPPELRSTRPAAPPPAYPSKDPGGDPGGDPSGDPSGDSGGDSGKDPAKPDGA